MANAAAGAKVARAPPTALHGTRQGARPVDAAKGLRIASCPDSPCHQVARCLPWPRGRGAAPGQVGVVAGQGAVEDGVHARAKLVTGRRGRGEGQVLAERFALQAGADCIA